MINQPIQTYAATRATPIYTSPTDWSQVADGGRAQLALGQTFSGRPDQNNTIWLSVGVGFIPADAAALAYSFQAVADVFVQTDKRPDAPVAEAGTARLPAGTLFDAARVAPGWLWLLSGLGFVTEGSSRIVGVAPTTYPGGAPQPPTPGYTTYEVLGGDTLAGISQKFYSSEAYWQDIYNVPENRATIGDDPRMLRPGMMLRIPNR